MDKRVEIHGTSRADMNGKCGVATDFYAIDQDRTKDRYTVQLDSGEAFKLKPANVRAEDALCRDEKSPEKLCELAARVRASSPERSAQLARGLRCRHRNRRRWTAQS